MATSSTTEAAFDATGWLHLLLLYQLRTMLIQVLHVSLILLTFVQHQFRLTAIFQIVLSSMNILANLYCLVAVFAVDSLRKSDFYFVFAQTVVDFFVSGIYNLLFGLYQLSYLLTEYCDRAIMFPNGGFVAPLFSWCEN